MALSTPVVAASTKIKPQAKPKTHSFRIKPVLKPKDSNLSVTILEVKEGDTLLGILQSEAKVSKDDAFLALKALRKMYDPSWIKVGQKIKVKYTKTGKKDGDVRLMKLQVPMPQYSRIEVVRDDYDDFKAGRVIPPVTKKLAYAEGSVDISLYSAIKVAKIPDSIRAGFIKNYSYDVDFQRDIWKGNRFGVLYEEIRNDEDDVVGSGNIIYSELRLNGRVLDNYYYTNSDGFAEYYDKNGNSIQKSFLRTPIDGARITSGFGMRKHPILGYSKGHKGLDFGAPEGTPIYAAGNGLVLEMERKGSYGKYIKIRHSDGYSTAYAHLDGYARGLRRGSKVKQGEVIAYVGTTGRSTGPHLHYELIEDGRQINPLSITTVSGNKLKGTELAAFNGFKETTSSTVASLKSPF
jgi:murein DD-endopeptidase MepM/ murein hydrolase activator NlpD